MISLLSHVLRNANANQSERVTISRVSFVGGGEFFAATRADVSRYLAATGRRRRALAALWVKTIVGFGLLFASWSYLVFGNPTIWTALPTLIILLIGGIVVSVCVLHDANHGAYFRSRRANHLLGWTVDAVLGFGSYSWRVKHNIHHAYPNVDGIDDDIDHTPLLRLAPSQEPRAWYRWQHLYIWPLYAFALLRWHLTDLANLNGRRIAAATAPPPRGWDLVGVLLGKAIFVVWVFVIPGMHHRWWIVLSFYLVFTMSAGLFMAVVFQLAHCVEGVEFVSAGDLVAAQRPWAVHEVETTADFCQTNRALTWFIGGLNYQIEHHLFPRLPHTIYPHIAPIVRRNAEMYGVRYTAQPTFLSAVKTHYAHVRAMSRLGLGVAIEMG